MPNNIALLILVVFSLQIFSISFFYVSDWLKTKKGLIEMNDDLNSINKTELIERLNSRRSLNNIIVVAGLILIVFMVLTSLSQKQTINMILIYSCIQLIQYSTDRKWFCTNIQSKLKGSEPMQRTASLQHRKLWNFVSLRLSIIAILVFFTSTIIGLYLIFNNLLDNRTYKVYLLLSLNTLIFAFLIWRIYSALYGKPRSLATNYISRKIKIENNIRALLHIIIGYNIFILSLLLIKFFDHNASWIIIFVSIYLQLLLYPKSELEATCNN